jgi:hemerythrin-like domain-containing protein
MTLSPIQHLTRDHRLIHRCLDAVEIFVAPFASEGNETDIVDRQRLWPMLDYLIDVILLGHEEKEETVLLPELEHLGLAWDGGPLAYVRREHRQGRYLVSALRQATHQRAPWNADDRRHFAALASEWLAFNRRHMQEEERVLFPEVVRISPVKQEAMSRRFSEVDREVAQLPDAERLRREGERFLEEELGAMAQGF